MTKELLRQLPLFAGLSDSDLDDLYRMAEITTVPAGETLIKEGSFGDCLYVTLEGQFEVSKHSGEREIVIAGSGPGEMIGEMSLLEGAARTATVRALRDARVLRVSQATFEQLMTRSPSAALAVVRTVTARLRNTEMMLRQSEKMAALGTLSAGLAHELNNPAAAVRRSSIQLRETLADLQRRAADLGSLDLSSEAMEVVNTLRRELPSRAAAPVTLDPLTRSDVETEIATWLEQRGVQEAWQISPAVAPLGWNTADLAGLVKPFTPEQKPIFLGWLGTACTVYALLDEVGQGTERISEIVKAVKSYSYLDQAPVQLVDLHEGLENTLIILHHKLKGGVNVIKDYASDLPRIEAYASELNQVWTNILDNAVEAMDGHGEIRIRTYPRGQCAVVEITDNGPGVPADLQSRIFDAFFTTKEPGRGTGLGLHISYNIVVYQHRGEIKVKSKPGQTTFTVMLPVRLGSG